MKSDRERYCMWNLKIKTRSKLINKTDWWLSVAVGWEVGKWVKGVIRYELPGIK